jgi:4-carboxymuconolactone decarboxylase
VKNQDAMKTRMPYPNPETLSPAKLARANNPNRGLLNVSRMAFHAPDPIWAAQAELGRITLFEVEIDVRLREMVIVRVAHLQYSEYEIFHHLPVARNAGITEDELKALETGDFSCLAEDERALVQFVTEVVQDVGPCDATLDAVRAHYSDRMVFEVVFIIGSYMMTARIAAVGRVDIDTAPATKF